MPEWTIKVIPILLFVMFANNYYLILSCSVMSKLTHSLDPPTKIVPILTIAISSPWTIATIYLLLGPNKVLNKSWTISNIPGTVRQIYAIDLFAPNAFPRFLLLIHSRQWKNINVNSVREPAIAKVASSRNNLLKVWPSLRKS